MANVICERCGNWFRAKPIKPGSLALEVVLWLLCVFPGVGYTIWRIASAQLPSTCGVCYGPLLQLDTPRGRYLYGQYHPGHQLPPA